MYCVISNFNKLTQCLYRGIYLAESWVKVSLYQTKEKIVIIVNSKIVIYNIRETFIKILLKHRLVTSNGTMPQRFQMTFSRPFETLNPNRFSGLMFRGRASYVMLFCVS